MQPLSPSLDSHSSQVRVSMLLFLFLLCCISSLGRKALAKVTQQTRTSRVSMVVRSKMTLPINMAAWPKTMLCITVAVWQTMKPGALQMAMPHIIVAAWQT
jgi:hypothetical protein